MSQECRTKYESGGSSIGNFLHKIGAYAFTHRWQVIAGWLVLLALLAVTASQFIKPTSTSISIPGTEAQQALDRFGELFPSAGKGSGRIVLEAPSGKTLDDYQTIISTLVTKADEVEGVSEAISPYLNPRAMSSDRTIAYVQLQLDNELSGIKDTTTDSVQTIVDEARQSGLTVEMGGDIIGRNQGEILGVGEVAGVVLALVVLVMTLGSLLSAGMPLATALISIGVSMAGLFSLSQVIDISSTTPVLAVMLGLAVGIDYSLFIISKYKSYLLDGYQNKEAAAKAIGTAGNAVIFAAATVVIALSALTVAQIPFMTTMGLAGAATVALAAIVSVTLVPALLGLAGDRTFRGKTKQAIKQAQAKGPHESHRVSHKTFWYRWGAAITRRPIIILVGAVLLVAAIALPVRDLQLGLPTDQYAAQETTQRKAYDILTKGFGPGFNGPLLVVVEGLPKVSEQAIAQLGPQNATILQLAMVAQKVATVDGVAQALPALVTDDGTKGVIQIVPTTAPSDPATLDLIQYLRDTSHQESLAGLDGVTFSVTGSTALQADINDKLTSALPLYLGVVVGLSLILLMVAFRSILIPIKATLGFLLSVLAMFGALVAVFQWGWFGIADAPGPIISFIPIIAIGVLFGLAMDYEFFLVSSMHEAYGRTGKAKQAVIDGFGLGSKVVTAAGIIMVAVFAGFILNHDATIQAIGFGLALGILVDAFIIRMTIVPAVMTLLGKSAWWLPKWLDKILPHISIEGEAETAHNEAHGTGKKSKTR
ncbi:MAG: MMPL family transporter [Candidatus Microsaccharimonas sp.]